MCVDMKEYQTTSLRIGAVINISGTPGFREFRLLSQNYYFNAGAQVKVISIRSGLFLSNSATIPSTGSMKNGLLNDYAFDFNFLNSVDTVTPPNVLIPTPMTNPTGISSPITSDNQGLFTIDNNRPYMSPNIICNGVSILGKITIDGLILPSFVFIGGQIQIDYEVIKN